MMQTKHPFLFTLRLLLRLVLCLPLLVLSPLVWAAQIQVSLDRNPVNINDSFQVIFTATEDPDDAPDFSPLEQNFVILHKSQSSNASWINGQANKTMQWTLNVMAKAAGNLEIPAIHFGKDVSSPLPVQITEDKQPQGNNGKDELFIKTEASPASSYVQAQILYTLRIYTRVNFAKAQLSDPELADAVIEKIGEDNNYTTEINGVAYSVIERNYVVFPQKSGAFTIKAPVLTADIVSTASPRSFNDFFSGPLTKTKRVEGQAITLDIKPAPAEAAGQHWLPAEQLELKEGWSGDITQMKVGEPLTRTLTLVAKGVSVGQLPELGASSTRTDLKAYPDQPVLDEQKASNGLVAKREEKIALIPSKPGRYVLPAVNVPWFNTKTQQMAVATLPETVLTVTGPVNVDMQPTPVAPAATPADVQASPTPSANAPAAVAANYWPWLSAGLALGWLATLGYIWVGKKPKTNVPDNAHAAGELRLQEIVSRLKQACGDNDALAAKNALLAWGRLQFNESSLGAIAGQCEARLRDEMLALNQVLYGKNPPQTWQGKRLFQAFTENQARAKLATSEASPLKPLYRL